MTIQGQQEARVRPRSELQGGEEGLSESKHETGNKIGAGRSNRQAAPVEEEW